jgi:hypothetical protein
MDRKDKLLAGIDLQRSTGLEIGALDKPIVSKAQGSILYIDHMDSASLRQKYANDPNIDVAKIVDVDAVWGPQSMFEALRGHKVDYILASHVLEHVPDLITWLEELRSVLNVGGDVRLAIPDRRFMFDYLRRETTVADIVHAFLMRAKAPLPYSILDHCLNETIVDEVQAWQGKLDPDALRRKRTLDEAMTIARDALVTGRYHDVHCWVFTPRSFAELFEQAAALRLINFACHGFFDTEQYQTEFFLRLRECGDRRRIVESWRGMKEAAREDEPGSIAEERRPILETVSVKSHECEVLADGIAEAPRIDCEVEAERVRHAIELAEARRQIAETQERANFEATELDAAQRRIAALESSTSWKITSPLRRISQTLRNRRPASRS